MLEAFGYEASSQTFAVRFGPSRIYHYKGVPQDVYDKLCNADSVGTSFANLIRGQYEHEVVLDEAESLEHSE